MQKLTVQEIRNKWIEFFSHKCGKEHKHFKSASLVPDNPTLLLTSAGMVQFVPYFLGTKEAPKPPRAVSIQKCARVGGKDSDLENIGRTPRHHSFFEMLGNFSIGDYFKEEAIRFAWQFVTEELKMPADKLFVSIFKGDETNERDKEAYELWLELLTKHFKDENIAKSKIIELGRKDNFWGPPGPTGPCGPCSEIYFDNAKDKETKPQEITEEELDGDRYVEIWNLVFMQFEKDEDGNFGPLAKQNIDTGAGLERLATILQDVQNSFDTDELYSIIEALVTKLNNDGYKDIKYTLGKELKQASKEAQQQTLALKIITDHLRCACFLIADGVRPSNLGRGYVLRMIIRRAARYLYLLTDKVGAFLYQLSDKVVNAYQATYSELKENKSLITDVLKKEEEQFAKTLTNGLSILNKELEKKPAKLNGEFCFDLYSTYGFPLEVTQEIAQEQNLEVDLEAYKKAQEKHSEASNTGAFNVSVLNYKELPNILKEHGETSFMGYDQLNTKAKLIAILDENANRISEINSGKCELIFNQTSFYAESGGQVGDKGIITVNGSKVAEINDTQKVDGIFLHKATALSTLKVGDELELEVNSEHRRLTQYHHSSCHLLQAALKKVVSEQIQQAGSQVGPEYTRFDFNFDRGLSKEEIKKVEDQINEWIKLKLPVETKVLALDKAIESGALAFFEEKYEDDVRVLFMGDDKTMASVELCGGIHVDNIGDIEQVSIASESSVAAGIRRIKMYAHNVALEHLKEKEEKERLEKAEEEAREKAKLEAKARMKELKEQALARLDEFITKAKKNDSVSTIILSVNEFFSEGLEAEALKAVAEALRDKLEGLAFVFLASDLKDAKKVMFICAASDELVKDKNSVFNAGNAVKQAAQLCGGGGGGRPNFAQAGAKDASKINEALQKIEDSLKSAVHN